MCNDIMQINSAAFFLISHHFKAQEMCEKAVEVNPWQLYYVPDHFKNQEMCDKAVRDDAFSLVCVPDWFGKQKKRVNPDCMAPIKMVGLVHVRRGEKRGRKIVEVTDSCF